MKHIFLFLTLLAVSFAAKTKISKLTTICNRWDPKVNDCATKSANQLLPHMIKGIRDYGFPPIDPLKIPFLELSQSDKPVGLKLNISDTTHEGMRLLEFTAVRLINWDTGYFEVDIKFPRYSITGTCDVGGKILLLPITGHGNCNLTSIDMTATLKVTAKPVMRDNKPYFNVENFKAEITFRKGQFIVEGLFGGNKDLGDTMNRFLNENAVDVLNEMKPTLEAVWSEIFRGLLERIVSNAPADEIFNFKQQ